MTVASVPGALAARGRALQCRAFGPMKPGLLELLACPLDGGRLTLVGATADGEVADRELSCPDGHRFAIRDAVPRLVPEDAGPMGDQTGTFDSFSAK